MKICQYTTRNKKSRRQNPVSETWKITYPNSDTDATLVPDTRLCDALVHIRLHLQLLLRDREVESDIQFRVRKVDVKIREALHGGLQRLQIRGNATTTADRGLAGQMGLASNSIDLNAVGLDQLDDALGTEGFGALLNVVVVVDELGLGRVLFGEAEGHWKICLANRVVPDGGAVGAVFIKSWCEC